MTRPLLVLALLVLAPPALGEEPPAPRPLPPREVCGDPRLRGTPRPAIDDGGGCGIAAPVLVAAAAGVALEPPATLSCNPARALAAWLDAAGPAFPAGLAAVSVVDAYSCRPRNRTKGAELSEHARGDAIDITAFRLADATRLTVAAGWKDATAGPLLRRLHAAACGPFGTVLGPDANTLHADHFHLDAKTRRSGPYCE